MHSIRYGASGICSLLPVNRYTLHDTRYPVVGLRVTVTLWYQGNVAPSNDVCRLPFAVCRCSWCLRIDYCLQKRSSWAARTHPGTGRQESGWQIIDAMDPFDLCRWSLAVAHRTHYIILHFLISNDSGLLADIHS